ncbi:MAG: hypothetical protein O3A51_06160 [Verrucomicrobia bacterium]|nr:hypothetical protein [Verrucomicrobiota bacterium]
MMSLIRLLIGLLLLPVCVAITWTATALATAAQPGGEWLIPPSGLALAGGYLLWLVVYFTLPRPVRTYILAHELTHALWGALMGAKIFKVSVKKDKGSVTLSKSNFIITLAPYFFPLYTVLLVMAYYLLAIFVDVARYHLLWLGLVGFTWGFHFSFTILSLMQHQSDIQAYGRVFSYTVIYGLNVLGICLWIVLVSEPRLDDFVSTFAWHAERVLGVCLAGGGHLIDRLRQ